MGITKKILDMCGVYYECIKQPLFSPFTMTVQITDSSTMEKKDIIAFIIKDVLRVILICSLLLSIIALSFFFAGRSSVNPIPTKCADFKSRALAQASYSREPERLKGMDRGGIIGLACEDYPYEK